MLGSIQRAAERAANDHVSKYKQPADTGVGASGSPIAGDIDDKSLDDALL